MRQVFLDKGNIVIKKVCQPILENTQILVEVYYSFLGSGSEISSIEKAQENIFFSNVSYKIKKVLEYKNQIKLLREEIEEAAANNKIDISALNKTIKQFHPIKAFQFKCKIAKYLLGVGSVILGGYLIYKINYLENRLQNVKQRKQDFIEKLGNNRCTSRVRRWDFGI